MAVAIVEAAKSPKQRVQVAYYVYTLVRPSTDRYHPNEVFYVGKGTKSRLFDHEKEAASGVQSRKCDAVRAIWASGGQVQKTILYQTCVERDALIYEWILINMVYASAELTNIQQAQTIGEPRKPHSSKEPLYTLERVQKVRRSLGLSQEGLARRTRSISARTIRNVEAGQRVTFETARQILEALNDIHFEVGRATVSTDDLGLNLG